MTTIDAIRQQFPTPIAGGTQAAWDPSTYCVGGALCLYFAHQVPSVHSIRFPQREHLARILYTQNPQLTRRGAADWAEKIIANNDAGRFDAAWYFAAQALSYCKGATVCLTC